MEQVIFGAGCFWGLDDVFRRVKGVVSVTAGYAGGNTKAPTYEQVCKGDTGHSEVILVKFDPGIVSFGELLSTFWKCHKPTSGVHYAHKYRPVIFYTSNEQKAEAEASMRRLAKSCSFSGGSLDTELAPAINFYPAEERHQNYYGKRQKQSMRAL